LLILLDEQLPRQLARHLAEHNVRTVQQQSWAGLKNGVLLAKAEAAGFAVLLTGDQNMEYQQSLASRKLGIVVLGGASNALEDLLPVVANALLAIDRIQPGKVIRVTA
jgi:hypothetical protein